jgi:hypothetical protein
MERQLLTTTNSMFALNCETGEVTLRNSAARQCVLAITPIDGSTQYMVEYYCGPSQEDTEECANSHASSRTTIATGVRAFWQTN